MPATRASRICCGGTPPAMASPVRRLASLRLPLTMLSVSGARVDMGSSLGFVVQALARPTRARVYYRITLSYFANPEQAPCPRPERSLPCPRSQRQRLALALRPPQRLAEHLELLLERVAHRVERGLDHE